MNIEVGIFLSILGVIIAAMTYILNKNKTSNENKRNEIQEAIKEAKSEAQITAKLDILIQNVNDMRLESKETTKNVSKISEKLLLLEQKFESHDKLIKKLEDFHH